jgi:hypothetical protein
LTNPEEIMRNKPDASRLWASDVIFRWGSYPSAVAPWSYNHRRHGLGSASHANLETGTPQMSGINELFGDGHVAWKDASKFNFNALPPTGAPVTGPGLHFVRGGGFDVFFY